MVRHVEKTASKGTTFASTWIKKGRSRKDGRSAGGSYDYHRTAKIRRKKSKKWKISVITGLLLLVGKIYRASEELSSIP